MDREVVHVGRLNTAILRGQEDLSAWSEEELIRGQRRATNGKFMGRPPKVVPKALHDELVKRKMTKAYDLLADSIYDAVAVLAEVAKDKDAEPAVRVKAATEILDRTMGKPRQAVEVALATRSTFEDAVAEAVTFDRDDVVDVDSWEQDDG